jgi:RNA polymerase sigma-70 factor (ECF subfamily)
VNIRVGEEQAAMQQPLPSEAEIDLDLLRSGDKAAFTQLVERYADSLYNLALKLLGNQQEAEDALQETFLNAYKAIGSFEGRSSLNTWLYRIAYNTSLMQRRKKRAATVSIDEPLTLDDGQVIPRQFFDWCCLPERDLLSEEALEMMDEAVWQLPESLRPVFVLRDVEGLSTSEAGEVLDLSDSAVKSRLHRARLLLREQLSTYYAGQGSANGEGKTDD